jgi:hypothetical protein
MSLITSQQVSFWAVHEHVSPLLELVGSWPLVGSPAWCELDDRDPVKKAALLDAARHWSLRLETCQAKRCEAGRDVAGAADWSAVARDVRKRAEFLDARPWMKRGAA